MRATTLTTPDGGCRLPGALRMGYTRIRNDAGSLDEEAARCR
jgi:hypothetical protein